MVRLPIYEREKKRISSYFVREIIKNIEGFFFFFFKIEWKKVEQCTCYYTFQLIEQSRSSIYDFVYLEKITLEIIIKITNFACIQIFFFWYKSRKIQYIYIYILYIYGIQMLIRFLNDFRLCPTNRGIKITLTQRHFR